MKKGLCCALSDKADYQNLMPVKSSQSNDASHWKVFESQRLMFPRRQSWVVGSLSDVSTPYILARNLAHGMATVIHC